MLIDAKPQEMQANRPEPAGGMHGGCTDQVRPCLVDPEFARLAVAWLDLPPHVRQSVMLLVDAAGRTPAGPSSPAPPAPTAPTEERP